MVVNRNHNFDSVDTSLHRQDYLKLTWFRQAVSHEYTCQANELAWHYKPLKFTFCLYDARYFDQLLERFPIIVRMQPKHFGVDSVGFFVTRVDRWRCCRYSEQDFQFVQFWKVKEYLFKKTAKN